MTLYALSDSAVVLAFGEMVDDTMLARVRRAAVAIKRASLPGVVDVVPAFAQVAVFYAIEHTTGYDQLCEELLAIGKRISVDDATKDDGREVEIPVCYDGEMGPDLDAVAAHAGVSREQVVALHSGGKYRVHAIGFAPGFAYLGGLPTEIHVPRRATPRPSVPAGAVGIGGNQTGVYPLEIPGGWNIIGRTPRRLFDPRRTEAALLLAGDRVKFRAITAEEFRRHEMEPAHPKNETRTGHELHAVVESVDMVELVRAGMSTTLQDSGRTGWRAGGVPLSGGADPFALRLANLLVGNAEDCAALEFTLIGPELRFLHDTVIALTGADFASLPRWQPIPMAGGTVLKLSRTRAGCRGYLAIAGGFDVAPVLGSRSTYVRAALGGIDGRALRDGDLLRAPASVRRPSGHWHIDERILPAYSRAPVVRAIRGAQEGEFAASIFGPPYKVTPQSDRMGVRLSGPSLTRAKPIELASSAVVPGTIQVPPDGQPIVLMADAQTLGGYPQIAHVVAVDLPLIAQLQPGDAVRFREITRPEAHELVRERERALAILRAGIAQKFA